jgi:hypothetical protein
MILCAERFDREQHLSSLPDLSSFSVSSSAREVRFPTGGWAERQTQMRGFDTMTLFADRHGRRLTSLAANTTAALWPRPRT